MTIRAGKNLLTGVSLFSKKNWDVRLEDLQNQAQLRELLEEYQLRVLIPLELPAILLSYHYACANMPRELIDLDRSIARKREFAAFTEVSRRIGRFHLKKLHHLLDCSPIQEYVHAVDCATANGWNMLVLGITFCVHNLSPHEYLGIYEKESLKGFISTAPLKFEFSERDHNKLINNLVPRSFYSTEPTLLKKGSRWKK